LKILFTDLWVLFFWVTLCFKQNTCGCQSKRNDACSHKSDAPCCGETITRCIASCSGKALAGKLCRGGRHHWAMKTERSATFEIDRCFSR